MAFDGAAAVGLAVDVVERFMPFMLPIAGVFAGVAVAGILVGLVLRRVG